MTLHTMLYLFLQAAEESSSLIDFEKMSAWLQQNGMDLAWKLLGAVVVYIVGKILVKIVAGAFDRVMQKSQMDETVARFLNQIIGITLTVVLWIVVLSTLGFDPKSLLVVLGGASLAVGLALKDNLSNLAGGVSLLILRPFKKGDFIKGAGEAGTVDEIRIFHTALTTPQNVRILVPNGSLASSNIQNFSAFPTRRLDQVFGIGYGDNIDKAKGILEKLIKADDRILGDPAPAILVSELADSSVNITLRLWVNAADYWGVNFDMIENVKKTFDKEGISIPFPQRDVHIHEVNKN